MSDDPLALETRRRLFAAVQRAPGLSAREVQRRAGTAWGETVYHLERLEASGVVHRERGPHQDFFFAAQVPLGERTLLRLGRSAAARHILVVLIAEPDRTLREVSERSEMSVSRASIHLRRLLECGVVASGRRESLRTFRVADPDRTARLLVTYRAGFADLWVERLVDSWGEMFPA
jgi:predicted transcriptional regulator